MTGAERIYTVSDVPKSLRANLRTLIVGSRQ